LCRSIVLRAIFCADEQIADEIDVRDGQPRNLTDTQSPMVFNTAS
jgi:hypothetical protein